MKTKKITITTKTGKIIKTKIPVDNFFKRKDTDIYDKKVRAVEKQLKKKIGFKDIKIGYQGMEGSFSEKAVERFFDVNKINKPIAKVTSKEVVLDLIDNKIQFGVVAGKNTLSGKVRETWKALEKYPQIKIADKIELPVHQCLFIKKGVLLKEITTVASHMQALRQVEMTINKLIPNARFLKQIDTAVSAMLLSKGILPRDTAVVCSKEAGKNWGLKLVKENIEDEVSITEFWLLKKE